MAKQRAEMSEPKVLHEWKPGEDEYQVVETTEGPMLRWMSFLDEWDMDTPHEDPIATEIARLAAQLAAVQGELAHCQLENDRLGWQAKALLDQTLVAQGETERARAALLELEDVDLKIEGLKPSMMASQKCREQIALARGAAQAGKE